MPVKERRSLHWAATCYFLHSFRELYRSSHLSVGKLIGTCHHTNYFSSNLFLHGHLSLLRDGVPGLPSTALFLLILSKRRSFFSCYAAVAITFLSVQTTQTLPRFNFSRRSVALCCSRILFFFFPFQGKTQLLRRSK